MMILSHWLVRLITQDEEAFFYVNDEFVTVLDLAQYETTAGTFALGTGFINGHEVDGEATRFTDYTLWALP